MRNRLKRAGMTLMELLISMAILSIALTSAVYSMMETQKTSLILISESNAAQEARRILAQISDDLLDAGTAMVGPDTACNAFPLPQLASSTCLSFTRWDAVRPLTDPITWQEVQVTYYLDYVNKEINDGKDNNDNGLIDEMALQRKEEVVGGSTNTTIIAYNIKEKDDGAPENGGLYFELVGNLLSIKITVQEFNTFYNRPQDRLVEHSLQRSVYLRN